MPTRKEFIGAAPALALVRWFVAAPALAATAVSIRVFTGAAVR